MGRTIAIVAVCAATVGCETVASTVAHDHYQRNLSQLPPDDIRRIEQRRMEQEAHISNQDPRFRVRACFEGTVVSTGPLGGPLEAVRVRVEAEGEEPSETRSDFSGRFHVCVRREKKPVGDRILFGGGDHVDKIARVRLSLSRDGWKEKTVDVAWDTSDAKKRFEFTLERGADAL